MKKINLKGISEVLSEKELKNVMGGSLGSCFQGFFCQGSCINWGTLKTGTCVPIGGFGSGYCGCN